MPKQPLTRNEQKILLKTAKDAGEYRYDAKGHETGLPVNAYRSILFMLRTGCHPDVLARPDKYDLRVEKDHDGDLIIRWNRPKKTGRDAFTAVPAASDIKGWVEEFVVQDKPRFRQFYNAMLRSMSRRIKNPSRGLVSSNLAPQALRHSFAVNLLTGAPPLKGALSTAEVQELMNCHAKTLRYYTNFTGTHLKESLKEKGW